MNRILKIDMNDLLSYYINPAQISVIEEFIDNESEGVLIHVNGYPEPFCVRGDAIMLRNILLGQSEIITV